MPISAIAASAPSASGVRASRAGQQSDSFQPVFENASKAPAKEEDAQSAGEAKPILTKSVLSKTAAPKKSDAAPVVVAADPAPQPVEPAPVLKTPEAPAEQPRPILQPVVPVEAFVLPALVAPPAPAATATAPVDQPDQTPVAPAESTQSETPAPVDPGTLVFQLTLNSPDSSSKAQPAPAAADHKAEGYALPELEPAPITVQARAGGSNADAKNQDQQEQPAPQPLPAPSDGTIASQFGFQSPMSFAAHIAAPKVEATAPSAPTRPVENVSTPELPATGMVDRIALTIRGESDQVVRVEINQSGEMVRVGVNTANSELASDLRVSVPELVHRLDQQGYDTKVNIPSFGSLSAPAPIATAHTEFRSGSDTAGNNKSQGNITTQDEPRQQRQKNPQKAWRELAAQLQED